MRSCLSDLPILHSTGKGDQTPVFDIGHVAEDHLL